VAPREAADAEAKKHSGYSRARWHVHGHIWSRRTSEAVTARAPQIAPLRAEVCASRRSAPRRAVTQSSGSNL